MARIPSCAIAVILTGVGCVSATAADDRAAVETVIRQSERAFAALDCKAADSSLAPGARWIEKSYPQPAESATWCEKARAAGIRISYNLHDFDVEVHGDVAWVTLIIDGSFYAERPRRGS